MTIKFSIIVATLIAASPATAGNAPLCGSVSANAVRVCDTAGACINVSPRTVCRAAQVARPIARPVALSSISMEEQGRRQLDRLIAGLR